jgi:hypothetical protein
VDAAEIVEHEIERQPVNVRVALIMMQRVAIASGYGCQRFISMVDQAMPKRLELPFNSPISLPPRSAQSPPVAQAS